MPPPKAPRKEYSDFMLGQIVGYHKHGGTHGQISKEFGIPRSSVASVLRRVGKAKELDGVRPKRTGRRPALSSKDQRALFEWIERNPGHTPQMVANAGVTSRPISAATIRRYIRKLKGSKNGLAGVESDDGAEDESGNEEEEPTHAAPQPRSQTQTRPHPQPEAETEAEAQPQPQSQSPIGTGTSDQSRVDFNYLRIAPVPCHERETLPPAGLGAGAGAGAIHLRPSDGNNMGFQHPNDGAPVMMTTFGRTADAGTGSATAIPPSDIPTISGSTMSLMDARQAGLSSLGSPGPNSLLPHQHSAGTVSLSANQASIPAPAHVSSQFMPPSPSTAPVSVSSSMTVAAPASLMLPLPSHLKKRPRPRGSLVMEVNPVTPLRVISEDLQNRGISHSGLDDPIDPQLSLHRPLL